MFVPTGQAAVFSARIGGRECSVVVHPAVTAGDDLKIEETVAALHQTFIDAVERFPNQDLMGLKADWPHRGTTVDTPEMVSVLTSRMLVANLLANSR